MQYEDLVIEIADLLQCPLTDADDALRLLLNENDMDALDRFAAQPRNMLKLAQRVQGYLPSHGDVIDRR